MFCTCFIYITNISIASGGLNLVMSDLDFSAYLCPDVKRENKHPEQHCDYKTTTTALDTLSFVCVLFLTFTKS